MRRSFRLMFLQDDTSLSETDYKGNDEQIAEALEGRCLDAIPQRTYQQLNAERAGIRYHQARTNRAVCSYTPAI